MQCSDCQSKTHHFSAHKLWEGGLWTPSIWDANFGKTRPREIQENYYRGSTCVLLGRCLRADFPICPQRRLPPVKGSNRRSEPSSTSVICFKPRCPVRQGVSHCGSGSSPPDEALWGVTVGGLSFPGVSGEVTRREGRSSPRTPTRHGWRSVGIGDWSCQNTARQKEENNGRLRCDCTTCHSFGLREADFIADERRLVGRTRSCAAVALLINLGHQWCGGRQLATSALLRANFPILTQWNGDKHNINRASTRKELSWKPSVAVAVKPTFLRDAVAELSLLQFALFLCFHSRECTFGKVMRY